MGGVMRGNGRNGGVSPSNQPHLHTLPSPAPSSRHPHPHSPPSPQSSITSSITPSPSPYTLNTYPLLSNNNVFFFQRKLLEFKSCIYWIISTCSSNFKVILVVTKIFLVIWKIRSKSLSVCFAILEKYYCCKKFPFFWKFEHC